MSSTSLIHEPCTRLKGAGPRIAQRLAQCDIHCLQDLLFHLPMRYEDNTRISLIRQLHSEHRCVVEGTVTHQELNSRGKKQLIVYLQDSSGQLELRFLHYFDYHQKQLQPGTQWRCMGEVKRWGRNLCLIHPEYHTLNDPEFATEPKLSPIYPSTEGLSQLMLRRLIAQAMQLVEEHDLLTDYLSSITKTSRPNLLAALRFLHAPPVDSCQVTLLAGTHPMQQRLAFEELLAHHLSLTRLRRERNTTASYAFNQSADLVPRLLDQLPFQLTNAQTKVSHIISRDLTNHQPMQRLVQGDVGCGKTIVAALAALQVIEAGAQVALMVPTELLAEQHTKQFNEWFCPLQLKIALLTQRSRERQTILEGISKHEIHLVIGTHALFQTSVNFARLGLVIIDEQHRFGVHQRLSLQEKGKHEGKTPHQLIMTATPIPRTLAMSVYADLDHAVIDELPPGRKPVTTVVLAHNHRDTVIDRIEAICAQGQQVYWLCTLIHESEALSCETAEATAAQLTNQLPKQRIALVHGQQKSSERQQIMDSFKQGDIDILVATTVIEVGVDVPNASLMIIDNAERLGLAQLHQLRGRVGRGSEQSYCVLLYQNPLSRQAQQRLQVMRQTQDGFVIAQKDLAIRGPGEVLGTKQ